MEGSHEYVIMTGAEFAGMFDPVIEDVLALVRAQLAAVEAKGRYCGTLLLVGGFAESDYLYDRIKSEFRAKIPVIVRPISPGSAIIQGAVTFGFNPRVLTSRLARKTYGIASCRDFQEGKHDPSKKEYIDGRAVCQDIFSKFVTRGQIIKIDDVVPRTFYPVREDQKVVPVTLYSTDATDPMYITDSGMHKESTFDLYIGQSTLGRKSEILVSMSFGLTSIEVKAKGGNFEAEEMACTVTGHFEAR